MHWTNEEIDYLKKNYPSASWNEMISVLKRSQVSITHKGVRLKIGRSRNLFRECPGRAPKKIISQRY